MILLRLRATLKKTLMKIDDLVNSTLFFAQAYGGNAYGAETFGDCSQVGDECIDVTQNPGTTPTPGDTSTPPTTTTTQTPNAPNTGLFGLTPDAAFASVTGALLVALAIVGAVYVVMQRRLRKKKSE